MAENPGKSVESDSHRMPHHIIRYHFDFVGIFRWIVANYAFDFVLNLIPGRRSERLSL